MLTKHRILFIGAGRMAKLYFPDYLKQAKNTSKKLSFLTAAT